MADFVRTIKDDTFKMVVANIGPATMSNGQPGFTIMCDRASVLPSV